VDLALHHAFGNAVFVAAAAPIRTYDHCARDSRLTDHGAVLVRLGEGAWQVSV